MSIRSFPRVSIQDDAGHSRSGYRITCSACKTEKRLTAAGHTNSMPPEAINKKFRQSGWIIGHNDNADLCPACAKAATSSRGARLRHITKTIANGKPLEMDRVSRLKEEIQATGSLVDTHMMLGAIRAKPEYFLRDQPKETDVKPVTPFMPKIISDEPRQMGRDDRRIVFEKLNETYVDEKTGYANGWSDKAVAESLGCPQKWVETVRDEMFGPVKINDEAGEFVAQIKEVETELFQLGAEIANITKTFEEERRHIETLRQKQQVLVDSIARLNKTAKVVERLYN